jgi:hypothetical protein
MADNLDNSQCCRLPHHPGRPAHGLALGTGAPAKLETTGRHRWPSPANLLMWGPPMRLSPFLSLASGMRHWEYFGEKNIKKACTYPRGQYDRTYQGNSGFGMIA